LNCALLCQLYVRPQVSLIAETLNTAGGIVGYYVVGSTFVANVTFQNMYSQALVNGSDFVGGLFGHLCIANCSANVNFIDGYSCSTFGGVTASFGAIIGVITNNCPTNVTFTNIFYNNQTNISIGSNNGNISGQIIGLSSTLLHVINSTFNETIWIGDRLQIETVLNLSPSTLSPSTLHPTAQQTALLSTTLSPSTLFPSTQQTTLLTINCIYNVPNCSFCPSNPIIIDSSQFNILCIEIGGIFIWSFQNRTSNTVFNSATLTISGTTFIEGNFTLSSTGTLIFIVGTSQVKSSHLNVSGCIQIDGKIDLILQTRPSSGNTTLQIISYNCSQVTTIPNNQVSLIPQYYNSQCDQVSTQTISTQDSLSVSLITSQNAKCRGVNLGLIVGLTVGIPIGMILFVTALISFLRWKQKRDAKNFHTKVQQGIDKKKDGQFVENKNFNNKNKTQWNENGAVEMDNL
jgi:hypothetical protein